MSRMYSVYRFSELKTAEISPAAHILLRVFHKAPAILKYRSNRSIGTVGDAVEAFHTFVGIEGYFTGGRIYNVECINWAVGQTVSAVGTDFSVPAKAFFRGIDGNAIVANKIYALCDMLICSGHFQHHKTFLVCGDTCSKNVYNQVVLFYKVIDNRFFRQLFVKA